MVEANSGSLSYTGPSSSVMRAPNTIKNSHNGQNKMVIAYLLAKLITAFLRNLRDARLAVNDGGCDSDRTVPLIARSR